MKRAGLTLHLIINGSNHLLKLQMHYWVKIWYQWQIKCRKIFSYLLSTIQFMVHSRDKFAGGCNIWKIPQTSPCGQTFKKQDKNSNFFTTWVEPYYYDNLSKWQYLKWQQNSVSICHESKQTKSGRRQLWNSFERFRF